MHRVALTGLVVSMVAAVAPVANGGPRSRVDIKAKSYVAPAPFDVNGDGRQDIVTGSQNTEAVVEINGTKRGVAGTGRLLVVPNPGSNDKHQTFFGAAITSADFDRDGYADVAVSAPGWVTPGASTLGEVVVFFGSATGLHETRYEAFHARPGDRFNLNGLGLIAADLTGDGWPDLVATSDVVHEKKQTDTTRLTVMRGGPTGLSLDRSYLIHHPHHHGSFGQSLAVSDIDRDGHIDLIVGAPGFHDSDFVEYPSLWYCRGREHGPRRCSRIAHTAAKIGAIGDVNGDGYPDFIGGERGGVTLFRGGAHGLGHRTTIEAHDPSLPPQRKNFRFGYVVQALKADNDKYADIVASSLRDGVGRPARGWLTVVRGNSSGFAPSGHFRIDGATVKHTPGHQKYGSFFGFAVSSLDVNGDGRRDLVIGDPVIDHMRGAVYVILRTANGLAHHAIRRTRSGLGLSHDADDLGYLLGQDVVSTEGGF